MTPTLAERVLAGEARAIARAISLIEDDEPAAADLIRALFAHTGRAFVVGVTGPPGAGKSTLVDRLCGELRRAGSTVGVIAVDPSSPFTGGAVLGDRLRMQSHSGDDGVFIRSMATRGHLGGLARATADAALVLDASGRDIVVIETVGVGQDEVDIVRTADVSIVTLVPGTGDDVQALKAGHHGDCRRVRGQQGGPRRRRPAGVCRSNRISRCTPTAPATGGRRSSRQSRRPATACRR